MKFSHELIRQAHVRDEVSTNIDELDLNRDKLTANSIKKIVEYNEFNDEIDINEYDAVIGALEIGCVVTSYPKSISAEQIEYIKKYKKGLLGYYNPDLYYYIKLYIDRMYYELPLNRLDRSKLKDIKSEKVSREFEDGIKEAAYYLGGPSVNFVGKYPYQKKESKNNIKDFWFSDNGIQIFLFSAIFIVVVIVYCWFKVVVEPESEAAASRKAYGDALMSVYGDN